MASHRRIADLHWREPKEDGAAVTTHELIGLLALGALGLNAGLVMAVALKQLRNLLGLRRWLLKRQSSGELVAGRVTSNGCFALETIEQTGKMVTSGGPPAIIFTDGRNSFEIVGGSVEVDEEGRTLEVAAAAEGRAEIWLTSARIEASVSCPSGADFSEAYRDASSPKGCRRKVELEVREGDRVWILGRRKESRLSAWEDRPLLVSMINPLGWTASRVWILIAFEITCVLGLAGVVILALWPPIFGTASTIGGALGLVYFLGIQPLSTAVRDTVKTPARRLVGATWHAPTAS